MTTATELSALSSGDRMGLTAFGSLLVHITLVLGITFTLPKLPPLRTLPENLEITLVQTHTEQAPEKADLLAQANQDGGGDSEKPLTASSPLPVQELRPRAPRLPTARPRAQKAAPAVKPAPLMLTRAAEKAPATPPRPQPKKARPKTPPATPGLTAETQRRERAQLSARIDRDWQEYQKRPRRKFLNARTREYKYAAYMDAWRAKVERVGNLNYPEQAKRRNLTGSLILDVALNPDGSIYAIEIKRGGSGSKILDDAATRIVRLASPFSPFPENIREDWDILHITRTWKFMRGALYSK